MSTQSNDQGRAFEFITLITLYDEIKKIRKAEIIENSSYYAAERAWNSIEKSAQESMLRAAIAAVDTIFDLEPLIVEPDNDILELMIQKDVQGESGDVRDILIIRHGIQWEIGLSLKHNHFAVKHSRLAKNLDFGAKWFGIPCSRTYWNEIEPIFEYLEKEKREGKAWRDLPDKEGDVYIPLLSAFMDEIIRSNQHNSDVPRKMVEYLLGEFDFYKMIGIDSKRTTQIMTFNLRGTLNRASRRSNPKINVPVSHLPSRIVNMDFKPGSSNTVELYMDGGWQFSFRIHNAATKVETSLKFDVQIIGMPATIVSINCSWN
jgi:hypothetical protein